MLGPGKFVIARFYFSLWKEYLMDRDLSDPASCRPWENDIGDRRSFHIAMDGVEEEEQGAVAEWMRRSGGRWVSFLGGVVRGERVEEEEPEEVGKREAKKMNGSKVSFTLRNVPPT